MARFQKRNEPQDIKDTMQLECDPVAVEETAQSDDAVEEQEYDDGFLGDGQADETALEHKYASAERALGVVTMVLAGLLICGSLIFWGYFVNRLAICAPTLNNWRIYSGMLICCAAVPAIFTAAQYLLKKPVNAEKWLVNMCLSGLITAVFILLLNSVFLGNAFEWSDVPTMLCFAVSGCALPAAVYMTLRVLITRLVGSVKRANALDWQMVSRDVRALCGDRETK